MFEKTISKKTVYQGPIFDIDVHKIQFPDGKKSSRDVVVHGPAVAIVARHENGKFLFINQFSDFKCFLYLYFSSICYFN